MTDIRRALQLLSYCTNYLATMPEITVYMNCDTRLAINLRMFDLSDYDEFIFAIKNYDYIDSSYAFIYRARKADMDENGEIIFKIDPDASKLIKPGAFYNFALLVNAFNRYELTEYKKLTENGAIKIEYGAQDLALPAPEEPKLPFSEILSAHLAETSDDTPLGGGKLNGVVVDIDIKEEI
jgi:hypothetical protein